PRLRAPELRHVERPRRRGRRADGGGARLIRASGRTTLEPCPWSLPLSSAVADVADRRAEPVGPLRRDVRLLGSLLGQVLVEQDGEALLAAVERVRAAARASRRSGDPAGVREAVRALDAGEQAKVLRAFGLYF